MGLATAGAATASIIAAGLLIYNLQILGLAVALLLGKSVLAVVIFRRSLAYIDCNFWSAIGRNFVACLPMARSFCILGKFVRHDLVGAE